jgi:phenylalanyl-tRNA synthetase alpha chain
MEKQVQEILENLSSIEKKVLPFMELKTLEEIHEKSQVPKANISKAIQLFSQKKIIDLNTESKKIISLDVNGIEYHKRGLPERRLLDILEKPIKLDEAKKISGLSDNEFTIALGTLKKKNLISLDKGIMSIIVSKEETIKKFSEEKFLELLPLPLESLNEKQKSIYEQLKLRKNIVFLNEEKTSTFELTELGKNILKNLDKATDSIDQLTPEIIKEEKWKNKKFRAYNLSIESSKIYGGKRQPYLKFLDDVKKELISIGFEEAQGPVIESNFWNCDTLFMPQNHPARGIHDIYFVDEKYGKADLRKYLEKIKDVGKTHSNGWKTGSDGWNYKFNEEDSSKLVLRSQGTAVSSRILADKQKLKIPGKYFSIARVFRPDILDSSHLTEFNQLEGIVVSKDVNLRHLMGLLKLFAERIAKSKKIKLVPSYFPFTEPSVELQAYFNGKWLELGGAGIFRQEVTMPLGLDKDTRVLAWGLGIDRLFMIKENITDIRELFSQDLNFLRRK